MNLKPVSIAFLAIALFQTAALCQDSSKKPGSYEALAERAKRKDQTLDFRQLRLAYVDSNSSRPDTDSNKKAMMAALNKKDYPAVIKNAELVLASNYTDMDAHFAEYMAYRETNQADLSELHKFILTGLLNSIADSGDGKTPETAYVVIDVHEEYVFLRLMGIGMPKSQSYIHKNGHAVDALTCIDPETKTEQVIYFNVDIPSKHGL